MRKVILAAICAVALVLTGCGGEESKPAPKENAKIGVITHLNASEVEYNELMSKLEKSYRPSKENLDATYKYFDKMSEMQLALESGQIDMLGTYQSVANYMLKNSPDKEILPSDKILSDSFCFAVRKDDTALKNDLNRAIKEMSVDGTLSTLSKKYITDLKDGAEPPFDMILANGTPAGFSTAVLEEVSKRIGKNIELIDIDSGARASILTSKGADVVFWVAVPKDSKLIPANIDMVEEIDVTEPYYEDNIVHVGLK